MPLTFSQKIKLNDEYGEIKELLAAVAAQRGGRVGAKKSSANGEQPMKKVKRKFNASIGHSKVSETGVQQILDELESAKAIFAGFRATPEAAKPIGSLLLSLGINGLLLVLRIELSRSGTLLKTLLTEHISPVRGLAVSPRHPYLFSCEEDKMVRFRLWMHWLLLGETQQPGGHSSIVADVICQKLIHRSSRLLWIRPYVAGAGKTMVTLTHHKKSVRALTLHPTEFAFTSGSAENIKQWKVHGGLYTEF
ncbi:6786_t:CDS:2 [Paraglomus occultum]|uniref:6786_t:CDS:1 n=1 Tax=Paraglomus occultum TaxID=144539 RepID=A0A9N9AYB0_9GLOM|nr:6786_t:CDS:2 [Paraglomus occultum]